MMKYDFYMFLLYNTYGKKLKNVLDHIFPGRIRELQAVRVPVQRRADGRRRV